MKSNPHVLKNVRTAQKMNLDLVPEFNQTMQDFETKLGNDGRILVRHSGTEPLVRVMLEGQDLATINTMADVLCELIRKADIA
jgi:phosphoglucosamine mutase